MTSGDLVAATGAAERLALPAWVTSGDPVPRLGVEVPAERSEPEEKVREAA